MYGWDRMYCPHYGIGGVRISGGSFALNYTQTHRDHAECPHYHRCPHLGVSARRGSTVAEGHAHCIAGQILGDLKEGNGINRQ